MWKISWENRALVFVGLLTQKIMRFCKCWKKIPHLFKAKSYQSRKKQKKQIINSSPQKKGQTNYLGAAFVVQKTPGTYLWSLASRIIYSKSNIGIKIWVASHFDTPFLETSSSKFNFEDMKRKNDSFIFFKHLSLSLKSRLLTNSISSCSEKSMNWTWIPWTGGFPGFSCVVVFPASRKPEKMPKTSGKFRSPTPFTCTISNWWFRDARVCVIFKKTDKQHIVLFKTCCMLSECKQKFIVYQWNQIGTNPLWMCHTLHFTLGLSGFGMFF